MALTLMLMMFVSTVCFAAVSSSGSKSSGTRSSTSAPSSSQTAPSGTYKSTAPANSYSNTAPAKQTTPSAPAVQPQSTGSSFWRNASMIGGGMLAGSLLGNMFGSGNMGGLSPIFGMLINLLMIGGVVMGIRYLWNKYKNKDKDKNRNMY